MSPLSFLQTPPPDVAIEIAPRHVAAVTVTGDRAGDCRLVRHAVEPLPAGAVVPALNATNIVRPADVAQAVARAWTALGRAPKRVALVVPDGATKVSFVRFETVPARAADLEHMVRFQVRKAAPFRPEEAQVSIAQGAKAPDGQEFVVIQARRDIIAEYERVCADAGAHAGIVSPATFAVANAVLASAAPPAGDWLLVRVDADAATLAIMRGPHMVFFRHRGSDGDGYLADLVHQTAMYYQDRLNGPGFSRALVAGSLSDGERGVVRQALETSLGVPVEHVDPTRSVPLADRIEVPAGLADALTPVIGLALTTRAGR